MNTQVEPETNVQSPARKRQRDAFERTIAVFRKFRDSATAEEMERVAQRLEQAVKSSKSEHDVFLAVLTGGQTFTETQRLEAETISIARYFQKRQELLQDSLSVAEVARLLGTCRQTPYDREKSGALLAVREKRGLRFPRWQFDPNGPDGIHAGFPEVLRALAVSPLAKASWFTRPSPYLQGRTPLQALRSGEVEQLVTLARAVGVN